jgi:glycerophosphoryl diester phosphodiesterase
VFDVQGHRGCRGLLPENSIPAFIRAVDLGSTTLELDVVISADRQVVVSHEHYMNAVICLDQSGNRIPKERQKEFNIYRMTVEQIRQFDCGSVPHPDFPEQVQVSVTKPLLTEVIDAVEQHTRVSGLAPVNYNIEIKCSPEGDGVFHPDPAAITDLVLEVTAAKGINERMNIQSFDPRPLQYLHKKDPSIRIAYLVSNVRGLKANIAELGFVPDIYSPYHLLVNRKAVRQAHGRGMLIIPWTVNKTADMTKLIDLGVDGIITDYPDRLVNLIKNH